jgi:parvulin-like peptidyl-prolyl isomerase
MVKQVKASHILVKTDTEAGSLAFDIRRGAITFEDAARQKSLCPSRKNGGDLGWFGRGQMVKEFEDVAFSTPKGEMSKPIKTRFGWHIIRVDDVK